MMGIDSDVEREKGKRTQEKQINVKGEENEEYKEPYDYLYKLTLGRHTYICKSFTLTTFPNVPSPRVASTLSAMQKPR